MSHISSIEITRFQGHKATSLSLHPNVNIILGQSDVGKSSIIRAISWVSKNRPAGDAFCMNTGKGDTEVAIAFENGPTFEEDTYVIRKKGKSFNGYDANGKELKAIRSDVPIEVQELMNMDDVNIQPQHKSYFMLDETPGQVAKMFNQVAGLEEMDAALKNINGRVRSVSTKTDYLTTEIASTEEKINDLKWTQKADVCLNTIEKTTIDLQTKIEHRNSVQEVLTSIQLLTTNLGKLPDTKESFNQIESILEYDKKIQVKVDAYNNLFGLCETLSKLCKKAKLYDVSDLLDLEQTAEISSDIRETMNDVMLIKSLISKYKSNCGEMANMDNILDELHCDIQELEKQCKVCPECGQLLPEKS